MFIGLAIIKINFVGRFTIFVLNHRSGDTNIFCIIKFKYEIVTVVRLSKIIFFSEKKLLRNRRNLRSTDYFHVVFNDEVALANILFNFSNLIMRLLPKIDVKVLVLSRETGIGTLFMSVIK